MLPTWMWTKSTGRERITQIYEIRGCHGAVNSLFCIAYLKREVMFFHFSRLLWSYGEVELLRIMLYLWHEKTYNLKRSCDWCMCWGDYTNVSDVLVGCGRRNSLHKNLLHRFVLHFTLYLVFKICLFTFCMFRKVQLSKIAIPFLTSFCVRPYDRRVQGHLLRKAC